MSDSLPLPDRGTAQRQAYDAGVHSGSKGEPKQSPYKRLVSSRTLFLSSWWERGWDDGHKLWWDK